MTRRPYSARERERVWSACCIDAQGRVSFCPTCNICGLPVRPGDDWDISHVGAPAALGGTSVGVAHRKHNREHGAKTVTPMVAKAKRQQRRHLGITGPGLSSRPLPGGRNSGAKKTFANGVVERKSQAELYRETMQKRKIPS